VAISSEAKIKTNKFFLVNKLTRKVIIVMVLERSETNEWVSIFITYKTLELEIQNI
jgi:hypothetical protein